MSEQASDRFDSVLEGVVEVAATWLQVGAKLSQTAMSVAADGLQATSEVISELSEQIDDEVERGS